MRQNQPKRASPRFVKQLALRFSPNAHLRCWVMALATLSILAIPNLNATAAKPSKASAANEVLSERRDYARSDEMRRPVLNGSGSVAPKVMRVPDDNGDHLIPLFIAAFHPTQQSFVRIINLSERPGFAEVTAIDDAGLEFGPVRVDLPALGARQFSADDMEMGNRSKLTGSTGRPSEGNWRLKVEASVAVEALGYIRTTDGFVTSMNEVARSWDAHRFHEIPIFNPAGNRNQQSKLRLINPLDKTVEVTILAWDDRGRTSQVEGSLPPNGVDLLTAQELEAGPLGWSGALGDGAGKWRLEVQSSDRIYAMSLLEDPTGHLANLSSSERYNVGQQSPLTSGGRIRLLRPASHPLQEGFIRVVNRSDEAGSVTIRAFDDAGVEFGPVTLDLPAQGARGFNSGDLEFGNSSKLDGATGNPTAGDWRLVLESDLDIAAFSYVRTSRGFLTSLNEGPSISDDRHYIPFFNPGSNHNQRSLLRLENYGDGEEPVSIRGIDDEGRESIVAIYGTLPPGEATTLSAAELEQGPSGWRGSLGDGTGKWRLVVEGRNILAMGLLEDPNGYITNLSTSFALAGEIDTLADNLAPPPQSSAGVLRTNVDAHTETTADFTIDLIALRPDSRLAPLRGSDLEVDSWVTSDGANVEFEQMGVQRQRQSGLGPYSATLLFDQSGSVRRTDPRDARISAARTFLGNLSQDDEASLLAFASGGLFGLGRPLTPYVRVFRDLSGRRWTNNSQGFDASLADLANAENGSTPLYDSIITALEFTEQEASNANQAVLVFTDGQDNAGRHFLEDAIDASVSAGIPLHTIALSDSVDFGVLSALAGQTGGSLTYATNASELISYYGALGSFLSGASTFYRTKWRVTLSGGTFRFQSGTSFRSGVLVALSDGVKWIPFYVRIP